VDKSGIEKYTRSSDRVFQETGSGWGWRTFISRKNLFENENGLIKDNTLTLTGKFKFFNESKFVLEKAKSKDNERLNGIYQARSFTDLEIIVQGRTLKAHKALVAGSSFIFNFRLLSLEENVLELKDLEFEVAEEMIKFIYDGKVGEMEKYAKPLLEAADKFKMDRLKVYCEKFLYENLSIENAIETLKFSAKCNAEELKDESVDFIRK
jgi:speckle-type POZ protein